MNCGTFNKLILLWLAILPASFYCQDTSTVWIRKIDYLSFKVYYDRKQIPQDFLKVIDLDVVEDFLNPKKKFPECKGGYPPRLNWIAKDKQNHVIISFSVCHKPKEASFVFLDWENGKLNVVHARFDRVNSAGYEGSDFTFRGLADRVNKGQVSYDVD